MDNPPDRQVELDAQIQRAQARWAEKEESVRPKRGKNEILHAAADVVREQAASLRGKGPFSMASAEKANQEKVQDLEFLIRDLMGLTDPT